MIIIPRDTRFYWIAGIFLSAVGVIFVRVLANHLTQRYCLYAQIFGSILAFSGLFLIAAGTSRKMKERDKILNDIDD